jgi:hypothetical protein
VEAATAADIGKTFKPNLKGETAGSFHCQLFSFSEVLSPGILWRNVRAVNRAVRIANLRVLPSVSLKRRD